MSAARMGRLTSSLGRFVPRMPEKLKGGRLERWADYWVGVTVDYKEAFVTIGQQMRERPWKSSIYLSAIAGSFYLNRSNPTGRDLRDRLQQIMNDSALMSEKVRNRVVDEKFNHLVECYNTDTIRRMNLILFSLAWEDNYSSGCAHYKATVSHLKPRYVTFLQERVLDVGFLGTWWNLERLLKDVDINVDEWDELGNQKPGYGPKKTVSMGMV